MAIDILVKIGVYLAITTAIFQVFYNVNPKPFIDEIFHIPQVQKYCSGIFNEWDSKITTLPGLYIASAAALTPFSILKQGNACTTWALRFMNILYNLGSMFMAYSIRKKLRTKWDSKPSKEKEEKMRNDELDLQLTSLAIGTFPLLYLFSFFYYTDPGSTFIVLAAYNACLGKSHRLAAVLGFISILFRQNNVIWVAFMAGTVVANDLHKVTEIEKISASPELQDKLARFLAQLLSILIRYLLVLSNIQQLLLLIWPYLVVLASFGLFVFINDGIVVGDRSSHQAVLHLPQLLYFSGFTLFFSSPILISPNKVKRFVHTVKKKSVYFIALAAICLYSILFYTYVHPYLLADNRHYVFYVWRWLLGRRFLRILLIPVYLYAAWSMNDSLKQNEQCVFLWRIVFAVCVAAVVVPPKLLEFRYFILPYILYRLHIGKQRLTFVVLELLLYAAVNIVTIVVFLNKTFKWSDLKDMQRIIW